MAKTFYRQARIITGLGDIIEDGVLVVSHGQSEGKVPALTDQIAFVGTADAKGIPTEEEGDETVNLSGCTLLPGLYNVHTRLDLMNAEDDDYVDNIGTAYRTYLSYRNAAETLNCGVTTVRVAGMPDDIDIALRNAFVKNMAFGPTLLASGPEYVVTGGEDARIYGAIEGSGADKLRTEARVRLSRGLDLIYLGVSGGQLKTLDQDYQKQMNDAEIQALTSLAHAFEKRIAANCSGDESVRAALAHDVTSIEYGYRMSDELVGEMAAKGVYFVPALCTSQTAEDVLRREEHRAVVKRAIAGGVKVCVGTGILPSEPVDGTVAEIREMELLCELGMTPMQAIMAATSVAAGLCGTEKASGTLETGKKADFIAVAGAPDHDISRMRNINLVVKNGRRAFMQANGMSERRFHIVPALFTVDGGTSRRW